MSDNLLDLGTTPVWRLDKTYMNWREQPKWNFDLARDMVAFDGTATQLVMLLDEQPQEIEFLATLRNKSEEKQFLADFVTRKGQHERFWFTLPSNRFTLNGSHSQGVTTLVMKRNDWQYQGYERIYILMSNGDLITRKITNVSVDEQAGIMNLTLSTATDRVIEPTNVLLISFMILCRLAIDVAEIKHISMAISETNVKMLELTGEYSDV